MKPIPSFRWGLIGAGGFGALHLSAIRRAQKRGRLQLVAVAEPNESRRAEIASELHAAGIRLYADYQELLQQEPSLNAVTITAPIPYHYEIASECLAHDLHIYLEKPPVPLTSQLEELIERDIHQRIAVGFQQIASPCIQQIKTWITRGDLGTLQRIDIGACWPRLDPYYQRAAWAGKMTLGNKPVFDGPATNALAHLLHNAMYLAGSEPDSFDIPVGVQGELYRARPIQSYDVSCLRGTFSSGVIFTAALTHATERELPFTLSFTGSRGWARLSHDGLRLESSLGQIDCREGVNELVDASYDHLIDCMNGRRSRVLTHLSDCRGYVYTTNAMLRSSGQIHTISPEWTRRYNVNDQGGYDVHGLYAAVQKSGSQGLLFSEQNLPWAIRSPKLSLAQWNEPVADPLLI